MLLLLTIVVVLVGLRVDSQSLVAVSLVWSSCCLSSSWIEAMEERFSSSSTRRPDWHAAHAKDAHVAAKRLDELQTGAIALKNDDHVLSYDELEEQFTSLLQTRGLVMIGDSTVRVLYGAIWCLVEGMYKNHQSGGNNEDRICVALQERLKRKCKNAARADCDTKAAFTNTMNASLEYIPNNYLGRLQFPGLMQQVNFTENKIAYAGMPCLHSLWSPGGREQGVFHGLYPQWPQLFDTLYTQLGDAVVNNNNKLLLGTTVTSCDQKAGTEQELIQAYLADETLPLHNDKKKTKRLVDFYNVNLKPVHRLSATNFSGPIPVIRPKHASHAMDASLFDEGGAAACSVVGLESLTSTTMAIATSVVDMHGATANGCDDTSDGHHYTRGVTLRRQLTLLLKAIGAEKTQ